MDSWYWLAPLAELWSFCLTYSVKHLTGYISFICYAHVYLCVVVMCGGQKATVIWRFPLHACPRHCVHLSTLLAGAFTPLLSSVPSIVFLGMSSLTAHTRQGLCCWAIALADVVQAGLAPVLQPRTTLTFWSSCCWVPLLPSKIPTWVSKAT